MAGILPFRALHYNPERVGDLLKVITQPYDKISPEMQARYYELSPYNLVRVIRGRQNPADGAQENVYTRAARSFRSWIDQGVLASERAPAVYPYTQEYTVPGSGSRRERRGFIALLRLEDYSARIVHRHEETLSGPKADRLELLKATRAHFGQLFMLYSDPSGAVEAALAEPTQSKPWQRVRDEYASLHSVWRLTDTRAIERLAEALRPMKLVIADGHHRYETALAYRDICRAQGLDGSRSEYVMVTLIRMETEGLTILPTHRVVHSLPHFDWAAFTPAAARFFEVEPLPASGPSESWTSGLAACLAEAGRARAALGAYAGAGRLALLRLRPDANLAAALPDLAPSQLQLDVIILHRLVLEGLLSIDRQAVREERNLDYVRELEQAVAEVDAGRAQITFLMNPTPVEAVRDNAFAGLVLPQKSTDFYPKLLSGLTIYWLDNPEGM